MRLVGCQRGLLVGFLVGALGGCFFETTPQQKAQEVCTAYCQCFVGAALVEECVAQDCLPDIPTVSDQCLDCVHLHSQTCSVLAAECTDLCLDPTP